MSARLPQPDSDDGVWGTILNEFLSVEHSGNGTLKIRSDGTIPTALSDLTDVSTAGAANSQVLSYDSGSGKWTPATVTSTSVSDASNSAKGIVQLAGDLGGSNDAANPTLSAGAVTGAKIADGTITNTNISDSAAIARTKLDSSTQTSLGKADTALQSAPVTSVNSQTGDVSLDADDIDDSATTNKFVTAGDLTNLSNLSGTNTGDQDLSGLVPKTTTVNGQALSSDVTLAATDVGAVAATESTSAPASPATDDLWYDSTNDLWKRWDGSTWVAAGPSPTSAFTDAGQLLVGTGVGTGETLEMPTGVNTAAILTIDNSGLPAWSTPTLSGGSILVTDNGDPPALSWLHAPSSEGQVLTSGPGLVYAPTWKSPPTDSGIGIGTSKSLVNTSGTFLTGGAPSPIGPEAVGNTYVVIATIVATSSTAGDTITASLFTNSASFSQGLCKFDVPTAGGYSSGTLIATITMDNNTDAFNLTAQSTSASGASATGTLVFYQVK